MSVRIVIKPSGLIALSLLTVAGIALPRFLNTAPPTAPSVPTSTPSSVPTVSGDPGTAVVFDDTLRGDWQNQSWAKGTTLDSTGRVRSGKAILFKSDAPFQGMKLASPTFDTRPYDRILLYLNGGPTGGQRLRASGEVQHDGNAEGKKGLFLAPLPANQWQAVVLPLKGLGLDRQKGVSFFLMDNKNEPVEIAVDDIRFLKPGERVTEPLLPTQPMTLIRGGDGKAYPTVDDQPEPLVK